MIARRGWAVLVLTSLGAGAQAVDHGGIAELGQVVVTATRTPHPLAEVPVETLVISREAIQRSGARNLPQLLRGVAGASASNLDDVMSSDNLRLTLRGLQLNEGYGLILVDGRRVHGGMGAHGDYGISLNQIPLSMIERVEIVKGAASALYGADAMAGVINIITRRGESGAAAKVSYGRYGMTDRVGQAARDSSRESIQASASYGASLGEAGHFDVMLSREQDEGSARDAQTTWRNSFGARASQSLSDGWQAEIQLDMAQARRKALDPVARHDRKYDDWRGVLSLEQRLNDRQLRLSASRFNQDFVTGFAGNQHGYRFGDVGFDQLEAVWSRFGDMHWLTLGAEWQRQRLDYVFRNYPTGLPVETIKVKRNVDTASLFGQSEIFLFNEQLTLVPGLRLEDHSRFGSSVSPRFAASWVSEATGTWRVSIGSATKSPTIRQLYYDGPYRHGSNYDVSNPDLKVEKAVNLNAGWERDWGVAGLWSAVTLHQTRLKDKVVRSDTGAVINGLPVRGYENLDKARISGAELSVRAGGATGLAVAVSAAWTRAVDSVSGNHLPFVSRRTLGLTPSYVLPSGRGGVQVSWSAYGRQYRNTANTQVIRSHSIVDARLWHALTASSRLSVEANNLTRSDKGEKAFTWRTGRYVGVTLETQF